ncbi:MAG TPA: choice-of-anchor D domain-containing protein [Candidatus Kapabacteria bacterium]|nr:choice-of-anchor D domain-containing protein [Candidatus Kapabacteria bacterium]
MKKPVLISAVSLFFLAALWSSSMAQWQQLASFKSPVVSIYFLHDLGKPAMGFVGLKDGRVFRTTDGGKNWANEFATVPPNGLPGPVNDIVFKDTLNGWIGASLDAYRTSDGGLSWKPVGIKSQVHALHYHAANHRLYANGPSIGALVSNDDGLLWLVIGGKKQLGIAFTNSQYGVRTSFDSSFYFTDDGGLTWQDAGFGVETWQPLSIGNGKIFLAASETFIGNDHIYQTVDGGKNWFQVYDFRSDGKLTGTLRGDSTLVYLQSDDGMYLSKDTGRHWIPICGPGNVYDTRFYAHGQTVIAGDTKGGLFVNNRASRGSEDTLVYISPLVLQLYTSECNKEVSVISLSDSSNCPPDSMLIKELRLYGPSKNFSLSRFFQLPSMFPVSGSIGIVYIPGSQSYDTAYLDITIKKLDSVQTKTITILGTKLSAQPYVLSPDTIATTIQSPCFMLDTFVTIHNNRCDAMVIGSASMVARTGITFDTSQFPLAIEPDSTGIIRILFQPTAKGIVSDNIILNITKGGVDTSQVVPITIAVAKAIELRGAFLPPKTNFGYLSLCQNPIRKTVVIGNPICKDIVITKRTLVQGPGNEFRLTKARALPIPLAPDESDTLEIEFAPTTGGVFNGLINFEASFDGITKDTFITVAGIATTSIAANLNDTSLDFGTISTCETALRETYIENTSCDSVQLTEIRGLNSGAFTIIEPKLPCWIHAGEKRKIVFQYTPQSPGSSNDFLDVYIAQSSAGLRFPLQLTALAIKEVPKFSVSTPIVTFDTITPCLTLDTVISISNLMQCDSIFIDSIWTNVGSSFEVAPMALSVMAPSESNVIGLHVSPKSAQELSDTIHIRLRSRYSVVDTIVIVHAVITGTRQSLTVSATSFDFGTMTLCDTRDTTVVFSNTGCDTVWVSNNSLNGSGFELLTPAPFFIPPGEQREIVIKATPDSTNLKNENTAVLSVAHSASPAPSEIGLRSHLLYPQTMHIDLIPSQESLLPGRLALIALKTDRASVEGLTALDVMADYNTDLLTYYKSGGSNTILSSDGRLFHITGNPFIQFAADSTIGTLVFRIALTQDTFTIMNITSVHPNPATPEYEECALQVSASPTITGYGFECGEKSIREVLLGNRLSFTLNSMSPLPAQDQIVLTVHSELDQSLEIELTDLLGAMVYHQSVTTSKGDNRVSIDIGHVASGSYVVTLRGNNTTISRPIIKEQ